MHTQTVTTGAVHKVYGVNSIRMQYISLARRSSYFDQAAQRKAELVRMLIQLLPAVR